MPYSRTYTGRGKYFFLPNKGPCVESWDSPSQGLFPLLRGVLPALRRLPRLQTPPHSRLHPSNPHLKTERLGIFEVRPFSPTGDDSEGSSNSKDLACISASHLPESLRLHPSSLQKVLISRAVNPPACSTPPLVCFCGNQCATVQKEGEEHPNLQDILAPHTPTWGGTL